MNWTATHPNGTDEHFTGPYAYMEATRAALATGGRVVRTDPSPAVAFDRSETGEPCDALRDQGRHRHGRCSA